MKPAWTPTPNWVFWVSAIVAGAFVGAMFWLGLWGVMWKRNALALIPLGIGAGGLITGIVSGINAIGRALREGE